MCDRHQSAVTIASQAIECCRIRGDYLAIASADGSSSAFTSTRASPRCGHPIRSLFTCFFNDNFGFLAIPKVDSLRIFEKWCDSNYSACVEREYSQIQDDGANVGAAFVYDEPAGQIE